MSDLDADTKLYMNYIAFPILNIEAVHKIPNDLITPVEKQILSIILLYCKPIDMTYPPTMSVNLGRQKLAKYSGYSIFTITRAMHRLEAKNFIQKAPGYKNGSTEKQGYIPNLQNIKQASMLEVTELIPDS